MEVKWRKLTQPFRLQTDFLVLLRNFVFAKLHALVTSAYIILHMLLCKSKTAVSEMFAPVWKNCFVISAHTSHGHLGMLTEDR